MKPASRLLRLALALSLALPCSCATSRADSTGDGQRRAPPHAVKTEQLPGGRLWLTFEPVAVSPTLELLRLEEAREVLAGFPTFRQPPKPRFRRVLAMAGASSTSNTLPAPWERQLREEFLSRYGSARLPMPESLEQSRLFMALQLSPRYMGPGIRDAAQELFSSPAFLASVTLSVLVYFAAWALPEPLFSKSFAAALTVRLALVMGLVELRNLGWACLQLYEEAEAARTVEELQTAAEHFGRAMGDTVLRALVLVASFGVSKALPPVSGGGPWSLLGPPRYAVGGGLMLQSTSTAMVADGSLVVTGALVGTAASAFGGACSDGSQTREGYQWHHLATNKNDISTLHGGPWTPLFKKLFAQVGMSLDAPENLVYLAGHQGPHREAYHAEVYERLKSSMEGCGSLERCRASLVEELKKLAGEVCTRGSRLHQLATKR